MSITIYEGVDGVGKTTAALNAMRAQNNSVYIHFPITCSEHIIGGNINADDYNISKLLSKDIASAQLIILQNIIDVCPVIMQLYRNNYHVHIDRFSLSNYVYRKLFCPDLSCESFDYTAINEVLKFATVNIMTCELSVIEARLANKLQITELDKQTEKMQNIIRAQELFSSAQRLFFIKDKK